MDQLISDKLLKNFNQTDEPLLKQRSVARSLSVSTAMMGKTITRSLLTLAGPAAIASLGVTGGLMILFFLMSGDVFHWWLPAAVSCLLVWLGLSALVSRSTRMLTGIAFRPVFVRALLAILLMSAVWIALFFGWSLIFSKGSIWYTHHYGSQVVAYVLFGGLAGLLMILLGIGISLFVIDLFFAYALADRISTPGVSIRLRHIGSLFTGSLISILILIPFSGVLLLPMITIILVATDFAQSASMGDAVSLSGTTYWIMGLTTFVSTFLLTLTIHWIHTTFYYIEGSCLARRI